MKILIIDDNVSECMFLSHALKKAMDTNLECFHEQTIKSALNWLEGNAKDTDLIFLDLGLPDTNDKAESFDLMRPFALDIPIIISTADTNGKLARKLLSKGAEDYIVKGSIKRRQDLLKETVSFALSRHKTVKKLNARLEEDRQSINWLSGGYSVDAVD